MKFARRAGWLTELFTPSVTPPTRFPDQYSNDVSLIQPYDGGGWGMINSEAYITQAANVAGASGTLTIKDIAPENIFRFLSAAVILTAGVAPSVVLEIFTIDGSRSQSISSLVTPNGARWTTFDLIPPIIGPNHRIRAPWAGGDAATVITVSLFGPEIPLGVSPTI